MLAGYPELVGFGAACLAGIVGGVIALGFRPEVVASREMRPSRVTEGTPAMAAMTVTNTGRRRALPLLLGERFPEGGLEVTVPSLAPGATFEASYALRALGRGVYPIGPSTIGRCDPLRLVSAVQTTLKTSKLLVHPRYCRLDLATIGEASAEEGVTERTSPRGGVGFHSLREYERGNDLRLVHWKASA